MSDSYSTEEIIRLVGDTRQIMQSFERHDRDIAYFNKHREELTKKYPDMFVAILDEQVIGHGRDLVRLATGLRKKGYDTGMANIERTYFSETRPTLILETVMA